MNDSILELRTQARSLFEVHGGWPDSKVEAWKYTPLRTLIGDLPQTDRDGDALTSLLPEGPLPAGITVSQGLPLLEQAVDPVSRAGLACFRGGWHLKVTEGIRHEAPLRMPVLNVHSPGSIGIQNRLVMGKGSRLTLIEEIHAGRPLSHGTKSPAEDMDRALEPTPASVPYTYRVVHHTHVTLEEGAELTLIRWWRSGTEGAVLHQTDAVQHKTSRLEIQTLAWGEGLVRNNIHLDQVGDLALSKMHTLSLAGNGSHVDQYSRVRHAALEGESHQHAKAIAAPGGTAVFNGVLRVEPHAQQTNAYQRSSNLMLDTGTTGTASGEGETGRVHAKPELQIFADNVRCSHGATMGRLNSEALFYLQSRGLSHEEARKVLTQAFAEEILEAVSDPDLRIRATQDLQALTFF